MNWTAEAIFQIIPTPNRVMPGLIDLDSCLESLPHLALSNLVATPILLFIFLVLIHYFWRHRAFLWRKKNDSISYSKTGLKEEISNNYHHYLWKIQICTPLCCSIGFYCVSIDKVVYQFVRLLICKKRNETQSSYHSDPKSHSKTLSIPSDSKDHRIYWSGVVNGI